MKNSYHLILLLVIFFSITSLSVLFSKEQSALTKDPDTTQYTEDPNNMEKDPNNMFDKLPDTEVKSSFVITKKTLEELKDKLWYQIDDNTIEKIKDNLSSEKLETVTSLKNVIFSKDDLTETLKAIEIKNEDIKLVIKNSENKISASRIKSLEKLVNKKFTEEELTSKLYDLGFKKDEIEIILTSGESSEEKSELYNWITCTEEDGLVYNGVLTFEFDPQGYAWIGTGNDADPKFGGVSVFNPRGQFVSFTAQDGLADNRINDILFLPLSKEDAPKTGKGGIWFATGYGVTKLDRKGKRTTYDKANSALPDNRVSSILLDDYENLWMSTFGGGVAMMDQGGKWTVYNRNNGLAGNKVVPSFKDKDGNLWFGIWDGGLSTLEPGLSIDNETIKNLKPSFKDNKEEGDKKSKIELLESIKNKKYSETEMTDNLEQMGFTEKEIDIVLKEVKKSGLKWTNYSMGNSGLVSNSVTCIAQNPVDRKMWFATSEGLSVFDGENWTNYRSENDKFLISNFVTSLAFETDGTLWIGYWGGGATFLKKDGSFKNFKAENSGLVSNYVGSVAVDRDNNKWFATYSGFSVLHEEKRDTLKGDPVFKDLYSRLPFNGKFNLIGKPDFSDYFSFNGKEGIHKPEPENFNTSSYHWQRVSEKNERISLRFALPSDHYGDVIWSYGAFWGDGVSLEQGGAMSYSITEDMMGNSWAEFSGDIKNADFLSYGYVTDYSKPVIDSKKPYPFPQAIPAEIKKYLLPGRYLPSDNPDIYKAANSLVKKSSSGDMLLTVKDILYSSLFRDMPYNYFLNISENSTGDKFITTTSKEGLVEDAVTTLRKNTGVCWSKARLFCSLCKAAGVPARLVVANGPYVWSEVWINKIGWVPVETSLPAYDYGGANRISIPKVFLDSKIPVSSVSGNDDDTKSIDWYPSVKATFNRINPKDLLDLSKLSRAKILILKPVEKKQTDAIPSDTMVPLADGFYFMAEKVQRKDDTDDKGMEPYIDDIMKDLHDPSGKIKKEVTDKVTPTLDKVTPGPVSDKITPTPLDDIDQEIYDIENYDMYDIKPVTEKKEDLYKIIIYKRNEKIDEIIIEEPGKPVTIEIKNMVTLTFIPVKINNYLILELIKWNIKEGIKEETTPAPSPLPAGTLTPSPTAVPVKTPVNTPPPGGPPAPPK
jgi:SOS response regulatory protein OraA/RecX